MYCDLCVAPRSPEEAAAMAKLLASMGVSHVAVEAQDAETARALARAMEEHSVEAYTRITVDAESWAEASRLLRKVVDGFDIVAVRPRSAEAARLAARDPRVAVVQFSPGMARYMDRSQAMLLREGGGVAEVRLLPLLYGGDPRLALRGVMVIARRAAAYEAPLAASSCARTRWELWPPMSSVGLFVGFGVSVAYARLSVSGFCMQALRRAARR